MVAISNEAFTCEHLDFSAFTVKSAKAFKVNRLTAKNLETYLKELSFSEELNHSNRTYLVKDRISKEIACFFTLRNGLFTVRENRRDFSSVPAVELSNFAVNDNYRIKHPECDKIGTMTFNDFVLPIVKQIQTLSGVQALYIYSLPYEKLMNHYKQLGFTRLNSSEEGFVHKHVKPVYDAGCIFMCQGV